MNWDEKNLDFDDELMLEKKRQLLERELAKQLAEEDSRPPGSAPSASMSALGSMAKKIKLGDWGKVCQVIKLSYRDNAII